jgi:hypothetical protein
MYVIAARSTGQVICSAEHGPEYVEFPIGTFSRYFLKKKKTLKRDVLNVLNVLREILTNGNNLLSSPWLSTF